MLLNDPEELSGDHLMDRCGHVQVLHPVELVAQAVRHAEIPVQLRIAVAELSANVGDIVALMIVPYIDHEAKDIIVNNLVAKLL